MYSVLVILLLCVPALGSDSSSSDSDSSSSDERFNQLIVFGDSYSDTGNVFKKLTDRTYPMSPPFYKGRYCNGPNWVDQLKVSHKKSYAYGSATTDENLVRGSTKYFTIFVPGIRQEVGTYLNETCPKNIQSARSVHVIWGGGNDFVFSQTVTPAQSVNSFMNSVKDLLNAGVKTLIIFNQPPAQLLPYAGTLPIPRAAVAALTNGINTAIAGSLGLIKPAYPNAAIYLFDVNTLLTNIISNPASSTFSNRVDACWYVNATKVYKLCPDANEYVFVDAIHFSTRVHQFIVRAVQPFFSDSFQDNTPGSYFRRI